MSTIGVGESITQVFKHQFCGAFAKAHAARLVTLTVPDFDFALKEVYIIQMSGRIVLCARRPVSYRIMMMNLSRAAVERVRMIGLPLRS